MKQKKRKIRKTPFYKKPEWLIPIIISIILALFFGGKFIITNIKVSNSTQTFTNTGKINIDTQNSSGNRIAIGENINNGQIINVYGNLIMNKNESVTDIPECPQCPKGTYFPISFHHEIQVKCKLCEGFNQIEIDLNKVKFNLPNNKSFFIDRLSYGEEVVVGLCNNIEASCYIMPQYEYDENDVVCMEINVSESGSWNLSSLEIPSEERKCLTLHGTNLNLNDNLTGTGLVNHFKFTVQKNGIPTQINVNFYKMRMKLPTNQFIYFDKFLVNESRIFAYCNKERSDCHILPKYQYNRDNEVCLDAILDDLWGGGPDFTILPTENRAKCVEDADSQKLLNDECTAS